MGICSSSVYSNANGPNFLRWIVLCTFSNTEYYSNMPLMNSWCLFKYDAIYPPIFFLLTFSGLNKSSINMITRCLLCTSKYSLSYNYYSMSMIWSYFSMALLNNAYVYLMKLVSVVCWNIIFLRLLLLFNALSNNLLIYEYFYIVLYCIILYFILIRFE